LKSPAYAGSECGDPGTAAISASVAVKIESFTGLMEKFAGAHDVGAADVGHRQHVDQREQIDAVARFGILPRDVQLAVCPYAGGA